MANMSVLAYEPTTQVVHTPVFDGPLELLLYLIRRRGVDIRFVEIAPITDAYLQHLQAMTNLQLDIAGEFLMLAATLCYLKSCELLPGQRHEDEESEEEDPITIRDRLAKQLQEYERFRQLAQLLDTQPMLDRDVFTKTPRDTDESIEIVVQSPVDAIGLLQIYQQLLQAQVAPEPEHRIKKEPFSLRKMGEWLLDTLQNGSTTLSECFVQYTETSERIICLLTALEMAKHQILEVSQFGHLTEVHFNASFATRPSLEHIFTETD